MFGSALYSGLLNDGPTLPRHDRNENSACIWNRTLRLQDPLCFVLSDVSSCLLSSRAVHLIVGFLCSTVNLRVISIRLGR